ncbi:MAG TPA: GFA family protein [Burkholderiaceae bacterium]
MNSTPLRGGCLCGGIRYEIDGPLQAPEHCHCSMCRKAHGAAFSTNAVVDAAHLRVVSGADLLTEYESSPNRRKGFCGRCGSQLFIRRTNRPGIAVVTLGTLDGDPAVRPQRHVFTASRASWYDIDQALPRFEVHPGVQPSDPPG